MSSKVTVYVTNYCPFCDAAKRWLTSMEVQFDAIDVTHDAAKRDWLVATTGMRTVPQIFVGDHATGGYQETRALDAAGGFRPLLDAAGVHYVAK